jgi:hypothetical protein
MDGEDEVLVSLTGGSNPQSHVKFIGKFTRADLDK